MSDHIGPYRLDEELGRGGMGIVYRGFDPAIGRTVAIKVIRTHEFSAAELAELNARFTREAAAAGKLAHPNIVTIYQLGQESGAQYMAMEFVAGISLENSLPAGMAMQTANALSILSQMADALDYAHSEGVVHRDVKPANVIVRPDGRIKITDFGIARITAQTMTLTGVTMGTPSYMAPEQILGSHVDGRADQFALGVIAYRLFSGKKPFNADASHAILYQIMHEHPPALDMVNAHLPAACAAVVQRALSKSPADRYSTCSAFVNALKQSFRVIPPPPVIPPRRPRAPVLGILVAAGIPLFVVLAIAAFLFFSSKRASQTTRAAVEQTTAVPSPAPSPQTRTAPAEHAAPRVEEDAKQAAPSEKTSESQRLRVGSTEQKALLLKEIVPIYPPLAKQARISGTVRFAAIIGKDGTIQSLTLISGHPLLVQAARDAIIQWVYKPTLLHNTPVEVSTEVDVNFRLNPAGEPAAPAPGRSP